MTNKRVSFRAEDPFIEELNEILDDINSKRKPNQKAFGVKNIVWDFMKEYTKTQPYGLVTETKRLKNRLEEIDKEIEILTNEKNEITAQIKVNENIINNTKLDEFKDEYTQKLEQAREDYNKRVSAFGDKVDQEAVLKQLCKKYKPIRLEDLKEIL